VDADQDGVSADEDCDDADATLGAIATDADCDGVLTAEDCDDNDDALGASADDADCDGVLAADDCDDNDAESTVRSEDGDCDGTLTDDDCDDDDSESTVVAEDGDCDGALTDDDCDDADSESTIVAEDGDCDGTLTGDDCDDADAQSTIVAEDGDCDGTLSGDDCDDTDSSLNLDDVDSDGYSSCDGDCDDERSGFNPGASDGLISDRDCDGVVSGSSLSLADYKFVGENNQDYSGFPVSSAGDVDGDGLDDLLIGGYRNDAGGVDSGAAYIVLASSLVSGGTINLSSADYKLVGESAADRAGVSVSPAGDVDGDGLDDVLVGADANGAGGAGAGAAYIVLGSSLGSSSTIDLSDADYKLVGEFENDMAGHSVSSAGDVDGDGLDDVLVGSPYNDDGGFDAGAVYIVLASSLGSSSTIDLSDADYKVVGEEDSGFALSVSSAGDVDGDGLGDTLLGAWSDDEGAYAAGAAYVLLGSSLGSIGTIDVSDADYKLLGEEMLDFTGQYVSSAGDVDGDGLDDLLIASYRNDSGGVDAGAAYIVLASSLGSSDTINLSSADYKLVGEVAGDYAGVAVSSAGDVDGDGLDDVMVGAFLYSNVGISSGMAYLILGSSLGTSSTIDLSSADYRMEGESGFDYAGGSVSSAGDVDGDGLDDVLVGTSGDQGYHAGETFLILTGG